MKQPPDVPSDQPQARFMNPSVVDWNYRISQWLHSLPHPADEIQKHPLPKHLSKLIPASGRGSVRK